LLIVHADTSQPDALALAQKRLDTLQTQLATATPALPPMALAAAADAKLEQQFVSSFGETAYKNSALMLSRNTFLPATPCRWFYHNACRCRLMQNL
jgi:hypothetical protein